MIRVTVLILSVLALLLAGVWCWADPGYGPAITFILGLVGILGFIFVPRRDKPGEVSLSEPMEVSHQIEEKLKAALPSGWYLALVKPEMRDLRLTQGYEDVFVDGPGGEQRRATRGGLGLMKNRTENRRGAAQPL
jgi:hypothetical protein